MVIGIPGLPSWIVLTDAAVEPFEAVRVESAAPAANAGLSPVELPVLRARLKRPIETVGEVALAIGKLGGHLSRKRDGMPGLLTRWRGMKVCQCCGPRFPPC